MKKKKDANDEKKKSRKKEKKKRLRSPHRTRDALAPLSFLLLLFFLSPLLLERSIFSFLFLSTDGNETHDIVRSRRERERRRNTRSERERKKEKKKKTRSKDAMKRRLQKAALAAMKKTKKEDEDKNAHSVSLLTPAFRSNQTPRTHALHLASIAGDVKKKKSRVFILLWLRDSSCQRSMAKKKQKDLRHCFFFSLFLSSISRPHLGPDPRVFRRQLQLGLPGLTADCCFGLRHRELVLCVGV